MDFGVARTSAVRSNWLRMAEQFIRVSLSSGALSRFTAGDAAFAARCAGIQSPDDPRMWGQVLQKAKREGMIAQYSVLGVPQYGLSNAGHRTPVWVVGDLTAPPKPKPARKGQPPNAEDINYDGPLPGEYRVSIERTEGLMDYIKSPVKPVVVYVALVRDKDGSWKPYAYTSLSSMGATLARNYKAVTFEMPE
jgi:hypothetical protein